MSNMSKLNKEQYLKLLYSCADNCPSEYCFFKVFLEHQHPDPRTLCQLKCIEIFKWEESEIEDNDIGLKNAGKQWCDERWAEAFATVYEEGEEIREVYRKTKELVGLMKLGAIPPKTKPQSHQ